MAKKKNSSRKKTTTPKQRKKQTRLTVNQKEWLKIQRLFEEQREENLKYAGLFKIETPDIFESEKPKRITKAKLDELQTAYNEYISDIIIAIIVYLSAFSMLIKQVLNGRDKKKGGNK